MGPLHREIISLVVLICLLLSVTAPIHAAESQNAELTETSSGSDPDTSAASIQAAESLMAKLLEAFLGLDLDTRVALMAGAGLLLSAGFGVGMYKEHFKVDQVKAEFRTIETENAGLRNKIDALERESAVSLPPDKPPPTDALAVLKFRLGDRYELEEKVAKHHKGKYTRIFTAEDKYLKRTVVIKWLHDKSQTKDFIKSCIEAQKLADLPQFVSIYEAWLESEECYVVMQLIESNSDRPDLRLRLDQPMEVEFVRRVARKIGEALVAVHSIPGAPGCNLKPSNILLNNNNIPYLSPRTRMASLSGNALKSAIKNQLLNAEDVAYVAPEELAEDGDVEIPKRDQYLLGLLIYDMLVGVLPSELTSRSENDKFDVMTNLEEKRPDVSRKVHKVIAKMLHPKPDKRYSTIAAALDEFKLLEQNAVLLAKESYHRCVEEPHEEAFFKAFYDKFKDVDGVPEKFNELDMGGDEAWKKQYKALKNAVDRAFDFALLYPTTVNVREHNPLSLIRDKHREIHKIPDKLYQPFMDALVSTVCDAGKRDKPWDPKCVDTEVCARIKEAWVQAMSPVVRYMAPVED